MPGLRTRLLIANLFFSIALSSCGSRNGVVDPPWIDLPSAATLPYVLRVGTFGENYADKAFQFRTRSTVDQSSTHVKLFSEQCKNVAVSQFRAQNITVRPFVSVL
jgi:hypothetical protein